MLPNCLIIGAQKAATSWLAQSLGAHPEVFMYGRGEVHFFDAHFGNGLEWYESHFEDWSGETVIAEKSPQYLTHPHAAERIRSTLGDDVSLIVSLRHPVERAYSAFWHSLKHGAISSGTDFVEAFHNVNRLQRRSSYGQHLQRFVRHFPRERILVLIFEEMMKDRRNTLDSVYQFLGVGIEFEPPRPSRRVNQSKDVPILSSRLYELRRRIRVLPEVVRRPVVTGGRILLKVLPKVKSYAPLSAERRQELLRYFEQDIEMLEGILDRDLAIWREEYPDPSSTPVGGRHR